MYSGYWCQRADIKGVTSPAFWLKKGRGPVNDSPGWCWWGHSPQNNFDHLTLRIKEAADYPKLKKAIKPVFVYCAIQQVLLVN